MKNFKFFFGVILFSTTLFSAPKIEINLEIFLQTLEKGESVYNRQEEGANKLSLSEKLKIRDELYKLKNQFDKYLNECVNSDELFDTKDFEMVSTKLLPLAKEVIRHLELQLEIEHNWHEPRHFSRIAKPLVVTATFVVGTMLAAKILEKADLIDPATAKKTYKYVAAGGAGILGLWILYNYRDVLARKLSCAS
jgi:hypothetical protein